MAKVLILVGSKSDMEYATKCAELLSVLAVDSEITVSSAHRHPQKTAEIASSAADQGFEVIIAMAGLSAALPGSVAAHSLLPVIGVPLPAALDGIDSLLSIAQMPPGIPVGAVGIGMPGAKNSAILAARILALNHPEVASSLIKHRNSL